MEQTLKTHFPKLSPFSGLIFACGVSSCSSPVTQEKEDESAALYEWLQHELLPWCALLQEQPAPAWVPHGLLPTPDWALFSTRPQVLPGAFSSMGFLWGHRFLWASPCSSLGFCRGCRWISVPLWISMDCRGAAASPWTEHCLQGNLCCSVGSTSSCSFCTHLAMFRAVPLTYFHFSLCCCHARFFPLHNYVLLFRTGILQFSSPAKTTPLLTPPSPPTSCFARMELRIGGRFSTFEKITA